jgi:hypothetical protein
MVFQTAHSESARAAHEIASQVQREEGFRKLLADRMTEDGKAVASIAEAQAMRAEERRERQRRSQGESGEAGDGSQEGDAGERALFADGSFDFLA